MVYGVCYKKEEYYIASVDVSHDSMMQYLSLRVRNTRTTRITRTSTRTSSCNLKSCFILLRQDSSKKPQDCCMWCRRINDTIIWPLFGERDMHATNLIFATNHFLSLDTWLVLYRIFVPPSLIHSVNKINPTKLATPT